jgi:transcriptional regulator with XRE-family HTH domain
VAKKEEGVGARLKRLRAALDITQQELAQRAGLSLEAVTRLEQRPETDPKLSTLHALARALGCTLDELCGPPGPPAA